MQDTTSTTVIERRHSPVEGRYKFRCTFDSTGTRILWLPMSCGLSVGDILPATFGLASKYGCPLCRRNTTMKVIEIPEPPPRPQLRGFSRLPAF